MASDSPPGSRQDHRDPRLMWLGDVANAGPSAGADPGKPLEGIRVLAAEQMQALPFGTQLMARLGAEVVKVEHPVTGESGRGALPAMDDPEGRRTGATFLRNNLNKRSVGLDLKSDRGRELFLELAPHFDVVAENFKPGTMDRLGLGYSDVVAVHPGVVYLSISGFGNPVWDELEPSPYASWPAYASIAEAMSGLYEFKRPEGEPPIASPAGALGDISTALFGVIGVLAALRQRDRTGEGQHIDVAMLDSMIAMTDLIANFWSLGERRRGPGGVIMDGFKANDGWFVVQVAREHQFERLAAIVGAPEWLSDERLATRDGWRAHLEHLIRPPVETWAADKTMLEACSALCDAGIPAGPCFDAPDVITDPHVAARRMMVAMPRVDGRQIDGEDYPVLIPGNPIKGSKIAEGPETRVPWVGEHTGEVLAAELGLDAAALAELRSTGVIS